MVSNMKYMLKAKRWGLMRYAYDNCRKYGTTDQVLFFDSEKDVLNFFKFALEEDVADKTANMDSNYYTGGPAALQTVMQIASTEMNFREVIKKGCSIFRNMATSAFGDKDEYRSHWVAYQLKCNPRNYKIFTIQEHEIRGYKFQKVELSTWYKFYKNCLASGVSKHEVLFNK